MEYLFVRYFRMRNVFLDGKPISIGKTNETLRVEKGTHRIDLGEPKNYSPEFREIPVTDTNQIFPLEIEFVYVGGAP
jgi:hypothetical protein